MLATRRTAEVRAPMPLRSSFRAFPLALAVVLTTGTGAAAQSQGPTLMQPTGAPVDSLRFKMRLHEIYLGFRVMFD
jgi:hypothetical protein